MEREQHALGPDDPEAVGRLPVTLSSIRRYCTDRAQTTKLSPDVRAWFADAATLLGRIEAAQITDARAAGSRTHGL